MKISRTTTVTLVLGTVILGALALITVGLLISPMIKQPVDSHATVQVIVAQTMMALQNAPVGIPQTGATSRPVGGSSLTVVMLENAQYHSRTWGDYQLVDGIYYRPTSAPGESPELYSTQLYLPTFGDVNSDGVEDAAVILQTQNGGNGNNKELAIVLDQGGEVYNVATLDIGFMVAVDAVQIDSETVTLNVRVLGPNDGLCCPSQLETWHFRLENNQLVKLPG